MSTEPKPRAGVLEIAAYQGGASKIAGHAAPLKLSSNENPRGPAPSAVAALKATAAGLHRYPESDHAGLRTALARLYGLDADRIVCGVGSDELIALLCAAYAGAGDEIIHTEHGFLMHRISALAAGATPVAAPEAGRTVSVDGILGAITPRTRAIFVANPANPTGTLLPMEEITRLAEAVPADVLLVLDGAYVEYVPGYDGGAALVEARSNVVMTRTFSKLYGLGGLRVGWAYAPAAVVDVLNRVRGPFNLSTPALAAAEAALSDQDWVAECLAENARVGRALTDALRGLGLGVDESHANFLLVRFASAEDAAAADEHLQAAGIIARRVAGYGLPDALRLTIPAAVDAERVRASFASFCEGLS